MGNKANQLYNSWSTCVKLTWDLPRSTHTYFVEDVLAKDFFTVKQQLVGRFVNFFQKLLKSPCLELRIAANMAGRCLVYDGGESPQNPVRDWKGSMAGARLEDQEVCW